MIYVETDRVFAVYVRVNRRVKWRYAEYGGRYETLEKAIEKVKAHFEPGTRVEYLIENMNTGETYQAMLNWEDKK